jgi:Fic-DOC domain mobile mystery protein B
VYGKVWSRAWRFENTDKNSGIDKWQLPIGLKRFWEDSKYWVKNETHSPEEIALRFKHSIVSIHCFPNGNGRHTHLMADILINQIYKLPLFSWGTYSQADQNDIRDLYLKSVKAAEFGNFQLLMKFARS